MSAWIHCMQSLGYEFHDLALLEQALSHRSYGQPNNERLEFLGDSLLNMIIALELYQMEPVVEEGALSAQRAYLVNGSVLAEIARELNLGAYLRLGSGELCSGGRERHSILADAVEAVIAAIYLDGGMTVCRQAVQRWFGHRLTNAVQAKTVKDFKTQLQEYLQAQQYDLPRYVAMTSGKIHEQVFQVTCRVPGLVYETKGRDKNRRRAEQQAAEAFLKYLLSESPSKRHSSS